MKKTIIILLILGLFGTVASACEANNRPTDTSGGSGFVSSETSVSSLSPTPIPTYTPGTELYGILSVTGEVVVEPKYEYLDLFSDEGLARFCDHGRWGFVNTDGEEVIPAQYDDANNFSEGLAAVKVNGLWGFIDEMGEVVIEPRFEDIQDGFINGRSVFSINTADLDRCGIIDREGNVLVKPIYESIDLYSYQYFIVDHRLILDREGHVKVEIDLPIIYAVVDSGFYFTTESDEDSLDGIHKVHDIYDRYPTMLYDRYLFDRYRRSNFDRVIYGEHLLTLIRVSEDGENWGLFDTDNVIYRLDPIFMHIDLVEGEDFFVGYNINEIVVFNIEKQETVLTMNRKDASGGVYFLRRIEHDFIVFETYLEDIEGIQNAGIMNISGEIIISEPYAYAYVITINSNDTFSTYNVIDNYSNLYDLDGELLDTYENVALLEYIPAFEYWIVSDNYDRNEEAIYGLMRNDGTYFIEPEHEEAFYSFLHRYHHENIWVLTGAQWPRHFPVLSTKRGLLSSSGFSGYGLRDWDYIWLASHEIFIVTENDSRRMGLVTWDGEILFELQDCTIIYPDLRGIRLTFAETDYLIYTERV